MNLLQRKLFSHVLREQAGAGGGDGGGGTGGGGNPAVNASDPAIAKLIQAEIDKAVAGLKTKNDELLGKLKNSSDQLKAFEGIDPVKTRELLQRIEGDAEAKLIAEGKMDEVLTKRTERLRADYDKKLADAQAEAHAALQRAQAYEGRVLDDAIRAAATKAGVHAHAVEDALFRGRTMFQLNDKGEAVALKDGQPIMGKDGKTPLTPVEWLESMKESAPHWFPAGSSGGGASGDPTAGGAGGAKTMKRAQFENLPHAEKLAFSKSGGRLVD